MTDKQMEEKKKEFYDKFCVDKVHPDATLSADDLWSWIEKLIEEVEESLSQNSDFLLKATRDLEQKSCNHMTNLK